MLFEHEHEIRVRYQETDAMGLLNHSQYFTYFEIGRTELLRVAGGNYRQMEEEGMFVVVVKADCRYIRPAHYDDLVKVRTTLKQISAAKIEHRYELLRGDELLAVGHTTLACVDRKGEICRVPDWMRGE